MSGPVNCFSFYRGATRRMCISQVLTIIRRPGDAIFQPIPALGAEPSCVRCSISGLTAGGSGAHGAAVPMNLIDELRDLLRRRELRDAVTEVENVPRMRAEAIQHGSRLLANRSRRREQDRRIEIAL